MAWPPLPQEVIRRQRLLEALEAGADRAVTVLCAGAGWGKTVLAGTWAQTRVARGPLAWLTLHNGHNDPYIFWSDLVIALRAAGALRPGQVLPSRGSVRGVDGPTVLRRMSTGMGSFPGPLVIVLDDLHEITEPRVLEDIAGLLRDPPPRLRLVLISRTDPELPLHRLRAAGRLTEIRSHDLAFRPDEAAELLALRGRPMPAPVLAALMQATEGWAAGLRLAVDAPPGTDPDEAAADYLIREVLAALPAQVRQFLLYTSVPDRICGGLASSLTGRPHAQALLEQLARSNLFLTRIGPGGWFQYHRQFQAALRQRLGLEQMDDPARLHVLAARWHAREGSPLSALHHAATAGDWPMVGRLVADHGMPLFYSANRADLLDVLGDIPRELLASSAELALCDALLTYGLGDVSGVAQRLHRARHLLAHRDIGRRRVVAMALDVLEATITTRWRGDMPRLVKVSTWVLAELAKLRWDQVPAMPKYRAIALNNKGIGLLWSQRVDHADRYLWAAVTGARAARIPGVEVSALGHLALLSLLRGSLTEARLHATAALTVADRITGQDQTSTAPAHLAQAVIAMQQGNDVEADEALRRALHASGDQPEATIFVLTGAVRASFLIDRGEPHAAQTELDKLAKETAPHMDAPMLRRVVELTQSDIDVALHDPQAVLSRYAGLLELHPAEQLRLAQAYQAVGRPAEAERALAVVREGPDRGAAVSAWLLTALAAEARGRSGRAGEAVTKALAAAEPEGLVRPFRRHGAERLLVLAERQQWTDTRVPPRGSVLTEITGEHPVIAPATQADTLSERETDVLQYMPTVLTAAEIADDLNISVNTVKAHLRSIYRKLGAGRRREAVMTARQLGLL
ncbi:LuxR family transcriptional regulator [Actinoplanes sp. OR16]|uniref:helix-turn-helix transcriptional regulator n=1 Tax=Actinoplanes sp. OR16 TaxID=946334 RepID=UPI000F70CD76|nr:LuxR C-terminal-related transcriptional regulator [Actinoplanes sp. OR16]BBH70628.1 LuxR family transcriptional regulator [Actinoplanes sp. OR16]